MTTRTLAVLVLGAIFSLAPRPAMACDCVTMPLREPVTLNRDAKTILVVGKVIGQQLLGTTGGASAVVEIEVQVIEAFTNLGGSSHVKVYTMVPGASCYGHDFRIGREYLISTVLSDGLDPTREVLPNVLPRGSQVVPLCGGAFDLTTREAQDRLKAFRAAIVK